MEKKKRFSILHFGKSEDVSENEEFLSYAIVILFIVAILTAVIPWISFFYNFTTF